MRPKYRIKFKKVAKAFRAPAFKSKLEINFQKSILGMTTIITQKCPIGLLHISLTVFHLPVFYLLLTFNYDLEFY
jgi:hypothetical protein